MILENLRSGWWVMFAGAVTCLVTTVVGLGAVEAAPVERTAPERSVFAYLQGQLAHGPALKMPDDSADIPRWRQRIVTRLSEILGLEFSVPGDLAPRVLDRRERDGYRIEHVVFMSEAGVEVPAYVLIPHGVDAQHPAPAVLCLQGVIPGGKDELAGEVEGNPAAAAGLERFKDNFAQQFVRAGFVTLAIDFRFDGERTYHASSDPFGLNQRAEAMVLATKYALMAGQSFFGLNLFDARRALDYLETRPEVQRDAIGCAGFSFGSTLGAWLAASDRRIKVVALEGNWPSLRRLALRDLTDATHVSHGKPVHWMVSAPYQHLPGFLRKMDLNLTVAAVAPTPMLLSYETDLPWVYANAAEAENDIEPVRRAYAGFGAADELHIVKVSGGHYWHADVTVPWLVERLHALSRRSGAHPPKRD